MRINEILGLRVRDIEGLSRLSVWIQPYGSKRKETYINLKQIVLNAKFLCIAY